MGRPAGAAALLVMLGCAAPPADSTSPPREATAAEHYHDSVLGQLADAYRERDLDRLERLLAQPRPGANADQRARFATFESLRLGLDVEQRGLRVRGFVLRAVESAAKSDAKSDAKPNGKPGAERDLEMDEACTLLVKIEPASGYELVMRAGDERARSMLLVNIAVEDILEDGSRVQSAQPLRLECQRDAPMRAGSPFEVEVPDLPAPAEHVKIRHVSLSGVLLPAAIDAGGQSVPLRRIELAPFAFSRFPKNFRVVRAEPLKTLEVALSDARTYRAHLLVASWFLARDGSREHKATAIARLIELLRAGPASVEDTARACLLELAGEDAAPAQRDREGWLRWWLLQRRGAR